MESRKTILLVEDDPRELELTISALSHCLPFLRVDVARDGVEALDYIHRRGKFDNRQPGSPAVILLDIKMPKLDGIQVLNYIKTNEALRALPIVILTSSRDPGDLEVCYRQGANAYVVKPVRFEEFVAAVEKLGVFWAEVNEQPDIY